MRRPTNPRYCCVSKNFHGWIYKLQLACNNTLVGRDYDNDWMPEPFQSEFDKERYIAWELASNIRFTANGGWKMGRLGRDYNEEARGKLDPPKTWPIYRLNPAVQVNTGEKVSRNGIYLPYVNESHPQVLAAGYKAHWAPVGLNKSGQQAREEVATLWTLVERVADEGGEVLGPGSPFFPGKSFSIRRYWSFRRTIRSIPISCAKIRI